MHVNVLCQLGIHLDNRSMWGKEGSISLREEAGRGGRLPRTHPSLVEAPPTGDAHLLHQVAQENVAFCRSGSCTSPSEKKIMPCGKLCC